MIREVIKTLVQIFLVAVVFGAITLITKAFGIVMLTEGGVFLSLISISWIILGVIPSIKFIGKVPLFYLGLAFLAAMTASFFTTVHFDLLKTILCLAAIVLGSYGQAVRKEGDINVPKAIWVGLAGYILVWIFTI